MYTVRHASVMPAIGATLMEHRDGHGARVRQLGLVMPKMLTDGADFSGGLKKALDSLVALDATHQVRHTSV